MRVILLSSEGADLVRGSYGRFSRIEPISLPDGQYMIPERCLSDPALVDAISLIESNQQDVTEVMPLPAEGKPCYKDYIYLYNRGFDPNATETVSNLVKCVQDHTRTIYTPEETPALFSFFRINSDDLEWIPNEYVQVGWKRMEDGVQYECIQAHQTLNGWLPSVTPALWQEVLSGEPEEWVQPTGAHDAYNTGDRVLYNGSVYESTIDGNIWAPDAYPQGWTLIE